MSKCTVHAVMTVMIEIPVRASSGGETLDQLEDVSRKEAERILLNKMPQEFRIIGKPQFSYATVRANK